MNKAEYFKEQGVSDFITWLAPHLGKDSRLGHFYELPGGTRVEFGNLADALGKYSWRFRVDVPGAGRREGHTLQANTVALAELRELLGMAEADAVDGDARMVAAATAVMQWGGVMNGNAAWLKRNQTGLAQQVREVAARLREGDEDQKAFPADLRFNAGMSKVYSLLVKPFIIYDSRVAAALAWLVMQWISEKTPSSTVPEALDFPCMPAKEAEGAKLRKLRNPSAGKCQFKPMRNNPRLHAQWNLRATWILEAALARQPGSPFHQQDDALRALEAALFMWGYDLGKNSPWLAEPQADNDNDEGDEDALELKPDAPLVDHRSQGLATFGRRALKFGCYFDEAEEKIVVVRGNNWVDRYKLAELFLVLHLLYDEFEYRMMPLSNNVAKLGKGTAKPGLGRTLMVVLNDVTRAQGASYLGPILVALKMLEWNGKSHGMTFRFTAPPPASIDELRDQLSEFA